MDPKKIAYELKWLADNPQFEERPATIREFVGPDYLNIESKMRLAVLAELETIMGVDVSPTRLAAYQKAMFTGGIGIGKTTIASVILPYLAHWVLCLKDPQDYFDLLPGSRIAFMQMSTSGPQAKEVVFGDIKARIEHAPWFQERYPYDRNFKNQIRFSSKDIWILPGDSAETTFEGYNILGGILDEADSHKVTSNKDYAEQGYTTIFSRISSRFGDRGFLLVIGQMKKGNGFAAKKFKEFTNDPEAYAVRMTIWESFGWDKYTLPDGKRDSFWYDINRKEIVTEEIAKVVGGDHFIEVPNLYRNDFINNPEKALRDLAGIPPATGSPFISLAYKVTEARQRWIDRYGDTGPVDSDGTFADWFRAPESIRRVAHIDLAYSANGDGLGLAMGHVPEMIEIEGENKPFIVIDFILRLHAPAGREIFLGDVRRILYDLKDHHNFNLKRVTMDGFQSTDTRQQLERRRFDTEIVSVDKQILPYHDLREALYENRIAFPPYSIRLRTEDTNLTEILVKELTELVDSGDKIDHPSEGSKDVADAVAGVVFSLMGNRAYHRKVVSLDSAREERSQKTASGENPYHHPAIGGLGGARAPIPPASSGGLPQWRPPRVK